MCLITRNIYGYVCRDSQNTFIYCCSSCKLEFFNGCDLELHSFDHDGEIGKELSDSEFEQMIEDETAAVYDENDGTTDNAVIAGDVDKPVAQMNAVEKSAEDKPTVENPILDRPVELQAPKTAITPKTAVTLKTSTTETVEKPVAPRLPARPNANKVKSPKNPSTAKEPNEIGRRRSLRRRVKSRRLLPLRAFDRVFKCQVCSAKFHKSSNLMRHIQIHVENRATSDCTVCGKQVLDLKLHMKTHNDEKPHHCTECPASFRIIASMHDHIRKHKDGSKQLKCSFCEVVVFSSRDFTRHIAKCTESAPEVALEEEIQTEMNNRMKIASTQLRECVLCGTKVKNIKVHLRSHTRERPFNCTMCDRTFTQTGHRNLHIRQVHRIEPNSRKTVNLTPMLAAHSCEMCCWDFDSMNVLDDHMRSHIIKGRLCEICGKTLTPGCISSHLRTHTGNKHYKCRICPTSFQRKDHLEEHLSLHTNVRPYPCLECEEAFFSSAAFKRHMRTSHPTVSVAEPKTTEKEKTICSICGKTISLKNIEIHMRVHSGERPYKCKMCPVAFAQKSKYIKQIIFSF